MANHDVVLNYDVERNNVVPHPNPVKINKNDTISFRLGQGPQNGKIRVKFAAPAIFSAGHFDHNDPAVHVTGDPVPSTYHCELFLNGARVAESAEGAGGQIEPASER